MSETTTIPNNEVTSGAPIAKSVDATSNTSSVNAGAGRGSSQGRGGAGGRSGARRGPRPESKERVKPEFDSKIIDIRRVTRVTSGGRRMSFSVTVVAGDKKGKVGVGLGKANDTSLAIDKATRDAKNNMIKVPMTSNKSIAHLVSAKYNSAEAMIMPVKGRGLVAGSSIRTVLELAGVTDVVAKLLSGSKNKMNNARVAIKALEKLSKFPRISLKTNDSVKDGAKA